MSTARLTASVHTRGIQLGVSIQLNSTYSSPASQYAPQAPRKGQNAATAVLTRNTRTIADRAASSPAARPANAL
eukprot:7203715-Prymnesium_polylepis.1